MVSALIIPWSATIVTLRTAEAALHPAHDRHEVSHCGVLREPIT
jgi:hypothetical protein